MPAQKGLSLARPFFFFFLLEDSSAESTLGFFDLSLRAVAVAPVDLTSLMGTGASAGFSAAGMTVLTGPTGLSTALGSAAGADTTSPLTPDPPAGGAICSGADDG